MRGATQQNTRIRANLGPTAGPRFRIRDGVLEFLIDEWRAIGEAGFASTSDATINPGQIMRTNQDGHMALNSLRTALIDGKNGLMADTPSLVTTGDVVVGNDLVMPLANSTGQQEVEMVILPDGRPFMISRLRE